MSGFTFDSNIIIDALAGFAAARDEIDRATDFGSRAWISRVVWVEVMGDVHALDARPPCAESPEHRQLRSSPS